MRLRFRQEPGDRFPNCRRDRRRAPGIEIEVHAGLHQRRDLATVIKTDITKWAKVIKEANITATD